MQSGWRLERGAEGGNVCWEACGTAFEAALRGQRLLAGSVLGAMRRCLAVMGSSVAFAGCDGECATSHAAECVTSGAMAAGAMRARRRVGCEHCDSCWLRQGGHQGRVRVCILY